MKLKLVKDGKEIVELQEAIQKLIGEKLKKVEKEIGLRLKSPYVPISEMGVYIASSLGKRLRPMLLLLSSKLIGYEGDDDVEYSVIIEFIHTATLIHDDIVDQAILRRGRASLNSRWGSQLAVLMGDYLYISAIDMAVKKKFNDINSVIAETSKSLIMGELLQSHKNYDFTITEEEYFDIIKLKTAKLFSTCTRIPPMLGGKSVEEVERLANFGLEIGMGFQIVDDCFDFLYDSKSLGKPSNNDLKEGKITLPLIFLRDYGDLRDKEFLEGVVAGRRFDEETLKILSERVVKGGFADKALECAIKYVEKAKSNLSIFKDCEAKVLLNKISKVIINRSF